MQKEIPPGSGNIVEDTEEKKKVNLQDVPEEELFEHLDSLNRTKVDPKEEARMLKTDEQLDEEEKERRFELAADKKAHLANLKAKKEEIIEAMVPKTIDSKLGSSEEATLENQIIWEKPEDSTKAKVEETKPQKKGWLSKLKSPFKKAVVTTAFVLGGLTAQGSANSTDKVATDSIENLKSKESHEFVSTKFMSDWNKYIDWIAANDLRGDESLNHNGKGMEVLQRYIDEHPGTSLVATREAIISLQKQFSDYRDFCLREIAAGRAQFAPGTTKDNFMKFLSIIDGIPGTRTTVSKFAEAYLITFSANTVNYNTVANKAIDSKLQGKITNVMNNDSKIEKVENKGFAKIPNRNPIENSDYVKNDTKKIPQNKK